MRKKKTKKISDTLLMMMMLSYQKKKKIYSIFFRSNFILIFEILISFWIFIYPIQILNQNLSVDQRFKIRIKKKKKMFGLVRFFSLLLTIVIVLILFEPTLSKSKQARSKHHHHHHRGYCNDDYIFAIRVKSIELILFFNFQSFAID